MATIFMAAYTNYRRDPRVKREAEALAAEGHKVVFLARRQPGEPNREVIAGVDVLKTFGLGAKPDSFLHYIADYLLFFAMLSVHLTLRPLRYRLIHINNMPDFLVFAAWLPRLLGRPVIHDIHDLMPDIYMEKFRCDERHPVIRLLLLQERWAGRFASAVLTVEDRLKDILADRGIPRGKIHVLLNLPDDRIFKRPERRAEKAPDAPFVLVYHGTLAHRLGLDIAIDAVALLRDRIPKLKFRIIGAGEVRERLIEQRDALGLREIVEFSEGFVAVEDIPARVADADVGVIALRISSATDIMLPTKLLEYMSMGIPVVSPKTGTLARHFDATQIGYYEAEDPGALAEAVYRLYADPGLRAEQERAASQRFAERYAWSSHKNVYLELVRSLISAN